jgi:hypothetical protein
VKFALATVPPYALPLAVVLKQTFGFDKVPPFANFYDAFPEMLRAVCGESELKKAGIDLVDRRHRREPRTARRTIHLDDHGRSS